MLKSLGLYAIMAQCGLFIPAKEVQLPIFLNFMSDIGDGQSIENELSTFSYHIKNLSSIIERANEHSLIILDELGTATDPDVGSALAQSILESLLIKKSTVLATTHLLSLKAWAFDIFGVLNASMIFNTQTLSPTYKLEIGAPGASYTFDISKRMGLDENIINRAKGLVKNGSINLENILTELEKQHLDNKDIKSDLKNREKKLKEIEKNIFIKQQEIYDTHKNIKLTAIKEAEQIILLTRKNVENLISEIRSSQANKQSIYTSKKQLEETLDQLKSEEENIICNKNIISNKNVTKGSSVFIPKLNSNGTIINPPDKNNKIRVNANGITIKLNLSDINLDSVPINISDGSKSKLSINKISKLDSIQIDIRGCRANLAIQKTEQFLDKTLISGFEFVYILHGKGSGTLMKVIHDFLSEQSFVKKYYFADDDNGGTGITIVELK